MASIFKSPSKEFRPSELKRRRDVLAGIKQKRTVYALTLGVLQGI